MSDTLLQSDAPVVLGDFEFQDFEVPEFISWGGQQQLTVHKLPGGKRVIDAMGRDDAPLAWSGVILSPDAAERAYQLDQMRIAGLPVDLTWGDHYFTVVVQGLTFEDRRPGYVSYKISCVVSDDQSDDPASDPTLLGSETEDVSSADDYDLPDTVSDAVGAAQDALSSITSLMPGGSIAAGLQEAIGQAQDAIGSAMDTANAALGSVSGIVNSTVGGLTGAVGQIAGSASGILGTADPTAAVQNLMAAVTQGGVAANLSAAAGFINRASANLSVSVGPVSLTLGASL